MFSFGHELWLKSCTTAYEEILYTSTKGQLISKAIYGLLTSPKKRTDEFVLFAFLLFTANKSNSSVRFLGESTAWQFAFKIKWPLHSSALFWVDSWLIALTSLMKNYQKRGGGQWAYYSTTFWLTQKKWTKWPWPKKCMGSNIYKIEPPPKKSGQTALKWE